MNRADLKANTVHFLSDHNQSSKYDFFCRLTQTVHPSDPFHLVFGLELFRHTLSGGVLLHQQIRHLIGRAVDFLQMGVQFSAEQQASVNAIVILLQRC